MLPCVTAPDLAGFDWPAARPTGILFRSCLLRRSDGGPPAEPLANSDDPRYPCDRATDTLAQVSPYAFDWPAGGTAEFLGRGRDAGASSAAAAGKPGKARWPEPLYVFGAAGAASDNRKTETRDALSASSRTQLDRRSLRSLLRCEGKKAEEIQGARS